jgi:RNA polymerase sigma factor (TIGR02999 family)
MPGKQEDVTELLSSLSAGDEHAGERLFSVVYDKLHNLAHNAMRGERPGHTLQTTALVHEAYLRLVKNRKERWENRKHFFSTAATAMRRILVDEARRRKADKRGSGQQPLPLEALGETDQGFVELKGPLENLEVLDAALVKLESQPDHKRKLTVVELRFFVGLSLDEVADVLGVSPTTVKRDWEFAKAWLSREMSKAV